MATRQRIVRVRRAYNQWVANQTLEDYALRFTAKAARRWSAARVATTALGGISFLALEAIGGTITVAYGFTNAVAAIGAAAAVIFLSALPISFYAARDGVDIDLLTRGAGFGYIGSTITSLIYAAFTFIFFAIEAVILASALEDCFGVPPALGFLLCTLAILPLVTHGITFISRVQMWSQPVWAVLQVLPFAAIALGSSGTWRQWTHYAGAAPGGAFDPVMACAAASVVFALVAQVGEQADYLRFLPARRPDRRDRRWWAAMLAGGPGWIVLGVPKLLAGSFLASLAVGQGVAPDLAAHPAEMYRTAFGFVTSSPAGALALAGVFVAVCQVKINITNAYAGSIAWSNFFSRLTHSHPGRVVWLVFNLAIALLLMELGIYQAIERTLIVYSIVAAAWVGAIVADLVVNKPLGLSPAHIEFKRAHLHGINPVGMGAMLLAVAGGLAAYAGVAGAVAQAASPFVAFAAAFAAAPLIAWGTGGRFYLARKPRAHWARQASLQCVICENPFEPEDMAYCPAYSGAICSLCCTLDARCHDLCKPSLHVGRAVGRPAAGRAGRGGGGTGGALCGGVRPAFGGAGAGAGGDLQPHCHRHRDGGGQPGAGVPHHLPAAASLSPPWAPGCSCWPRTAAASPRRSAVGKPRCCSPRSTPIAAPTPNWKKPSRSPRPPTWRKAATWSASATSCAARSTPSSATPNCWSGTAPLTRAAAATSASSGAAASTWPG